MSMVLKDRLVRYLAHVRGGDGWEQPLMDHLRNVGRLSESFAGKIGLGDAGKMIGLLHDLGKYSRSFQNYLLSSSGKINPDSEEYMDPFSKKGKIDHSTAGAKYIWEKLRGVGKCGQGEVCAQIMALCIASHHSGMIDCLSKDDKLVFWDRMDKPDEGTRYSECLSAMENELKTLLNESLDDSKVNSTVNSFFSYLNKTARFSTGEKYGFSTIGAFNLGMTARFLLSCLVDADRIDSAEFEDPSRKKERLRRRDFDWQTGIDRLERVLDSYKQDSQVNEIRRRISDECLERADDPQGIYTLSVPTGGGKTLLSLRYAMRHALRHDLHRIIYVVPFTSIIEQNAQEVRSILEGEGDACPWVLEHHSNIEPERQTWSYKLAAENWDCPVVFTTMVQFLETLFRGGNSRVRRMHMLAKTVLVFDEIQSLPIKCTHLFCNALNFLVEQAGSTAVLCTATQPTLDRLSSLGNPGLAEKGELHMAENSELVSDKTSLFDDLRRVRVSNLSRSGGWSKEEIGDLALKRLEDFGNCLVVVNTKTWAKRLFEYCSSETEAEVTFHLSTGQCPAHRKERLAVIRKRLSEGRRVLCISTQLIEAGVDVDFGAVIRFIAGLDSIAQAAGRCNRHGELRDSEGVPMMGDVSIVNPSEEKISTLKDILIGQEKTKRILSEYEEEHRHELKACEATDYSGLLDPITLYRYFDYFFFERTDEMGYNFSGKGSRDDNLLNLLSLNDKSGLAEFNVKRKSTGKAPLLLQSFKFAGDIFRAIDAPTNSVICPYGAGKELISKLCSLSIGFEFEEYGTLLRRAQQYSVNVFPNVWKRLCNAGAVHEIQEGEGVFYLDKAFYNSDFGLCLEQDSPMELLMS
ncbi:MULTISPECIES: CRISPR-associated endonuclease Cas3'' [Dethiosulfovibrio]|uniref:CRISPR-associated endonuclease Cas3 n=3 Tax=Dethiosulfovibrio TaxID=47054 RepID=A0ABS9EMJ0_9BACT|nr:MULTISPECIES: CRISPR-associated endonuclease Cas3'' [Dethiosulfovibrio]MCF4114880.1 CRISPR-associated endonuclease Cas3'' [Dethiosulfovibrio russensis]MCF4142401.1 CRISPR-associated endonuclease Cas3'' [Dethiosulfovibrio marinus]MCF4145372.1 CRISPR-associated endonuclease Cas3'' [Dethiosulfovibrio acidaminovorans]